MNTSLASTLRTRRMTTSGIRLRLGLLRRRRIRAESSRMSSCDIAKVTMTGKSQRAFVPTSALAKSVTFDEEMMHVSLTDGRLISVPIIWFPLLLRATSDQRTKYEISGGGTSLHWPELDEDLSVAGLF